jgi:hypothetical protein
MKPQLGATIVYLLNGPAASATAAPRPTQFERVTFAYGEPRLIQNPALPKRRGHH